MANLQARVQLDSYFYNIIGDHQGGFGRVWLLERKRLPVTSSLDPV